MGQNKNGAAQITRITVQYSQYSLQYLVKLSCRNAIYHCKAGYLGKFA